jgi:GT2 family glycosyltransferase/glycosyltransferase involved in cell wall biosynthesis
MTAVSVVVPVRDGERYLEELLGALAREGVDEVVVVDSGSRDRSVELARAAGARVIEIAPDEFGHGATRNLGAEQARGELICFLTQDATPVAGWLGAMREAFALAPHVGAAYGPHLPRPATSPMIARELEEFFAGFAPNGTPVVQREGDAAFLSNVNACYARDCWEEIRFRDVPYAEDQAFGRELLAAGWAKVYHPRAAVLHAHDYDALDFARRYFDEYRGLRETVGHVEPFALRAAAGDVRRQVAADRRWMARHRAPGRARWSARSVVHHSGRKVFSALGSRAGSLPGPVQERLSLERRGTPRASGAVPTSRIEPKLARHPYEAVARVLAEGPAPLADPVPGMAARERLHLAMIIPHYRRGSGGHNLLAQVLVRLERMGHTCSVWHVDPEGDQAEAAAVIRGGIIDHFAPLHGPVFKGFDGWFGADVAIATSWITAYHALALQDCRSRVYMVNDHEPEFFPTSTERDFATRSYSYGMPVIAGSRWLSELVAERYGASGTHFTYGVDHAVYHPEPVERRRDTVVFYARASTPRRAVPLGLLALGIVKGRRPDLRIVLFGDSDPPRTTFAYENAGIASPEQLARLYSEATVGVCLSMTNYSLVPKEMLACGLPVVDLRGQSAASIFPDGGPVALTEHDPWDLARTIERLLDDQREWSARSSEGIAAVAGHTWERAAEEVERGLRDALAAAERR